MKRIIAWAAAYVIGAGLMIGGVAVANTTPVVAQIGLVQVAASPYYVCASKDRIYTNRTWVQAAALMATGRYTCWRQP